MQGIFVIKKDQLAIRDIPEPIPGPYEALVKVEACAICNSTDWKIIKGEFVSGTYPILLGHESVGCVIQVGKKVRNFKPGDRVLRATLRDEHLSIPGSRSCWGGFVEKALVTDVWAEKEQPYNAFPHPQQILPASISRDQATSLITLKETLSCLEKTDIQPSQSLAIIGTGPVAQALTCFAKLAGITPVVVFGRKPEWALKFLKLGASYYISGNEFSTQVEEILASGGFDRVIEAVGNRLALSLGLSIVNSRGKINLYGIPPETEPYLFVDENDPRVFRSNVAEAETHDKVLSLVTTGKIDLSEWITCTLPWVNYQDGFNLVKYKKADKVVLDFV